MGSCVCSSVVRLTDAAADLSPSVVNVSGDGWLVPPQEVCVSWLAVVDGCVMPSVVGLVDTWVDPIAVAVVTSVSSEDMSAVGCDVGPASGEVVSLPRDGVEAMPGSVVISGVTRCSDGIKALNFIIISIIRFY